MLYKISNYSYLLPEVQEPEDIIAHVKQHSLTCAFINRGYHHLPAAAVQIRAMYF